MSSKVPNEWRDIGEVMSNLDHTIDRKVAATLKLGGCYGIHSAWNFNGRVWFADGKWYEEPWRYQCPNEVISADSIEELMMQANEKYGSD